MAFKYWTPNAAKVAKRVSWTVTGTWATNDSAELELAGAVLTCTIGSATTTADVAEELARIINGGTPEDGASHDGIGPNHGQWAEYTAVSSGSVLQIIGQLGKVQATPTLTATTAGSGDFSAATVVTPSGPNIVNLAENWSGGTVPASGDIVICDSGSESMLYNLDLLNPLSGLIRTGRYSGHIGLDEINTDNPALPYPEYRPQKLVVDPPSNTAYTVKIGDGSGLSDGRTYLYCIGDGGGTNGQPTIIVNDTAGKRSDGSYPVQLKGTKAKLRVIRGHVEYGQVEAIDDELGELVVERKPDGVTTENSVLVNVDVENPVINGGLVELRGLVTLGYMQRGGTVVVTNDGSHTGVDFDVYNGTLIVNGDGPYGIMSVHANAAEGTSGKIDFSRDSRAKTVEKLRFVGGGTIDDTNECVTSTNGIQIEDGGWASVTYRGSRNKTWTAA
jgi:hypothetical protein